VASRRRGGRVVAPGRPGRHEVLRVLADRVAGLDRPATVAVDGPDGAGKTVLADELARLVPGAVRSSLDYFHHPRSHRYARGRTGVTVWERSFDYAAVRRELLEPWRRGPGTAYRQRWHDLVTDAHVDERRRPVPADGVLLVDGVFAQRPELAGLWDLVVYVDADDEVRMARMAVRDGVPADADHPAQRRYLEAQRIYRDTCHPRRSADVVVDNTDVRHPRALVPDGAGGLEEIR
jgi:uridine kinase